MDVWQNPKPDRDLRQSRFRSGWIGLLISISIVSAACSRPSDEQWIRAALDEMQEAMESGKPADFMQHVDKDFTGADGQLDKAALHNLLRMQVLGNARIGVTLSSTEVELQGDRATVTVTATLSGGNGRWIPERGAIYRIKSGWRSEAGDWLCINAQWERVL